ncbi:hypothetical protein DPSP01_005603 [Paraphaeosphaeria sporulosa]|uniref:Uncharacterized protein n=1 Tax=Paraphaeosphaeria sporulosa TaxID=1460663 RepID=A0A177CU20_9PLEO|nr:uncharacterized protein CC84DRAFT_1083261 [Paraphaeosphaeria sporulosa]OAG10508.1 hypothetical protein CC84DRAFT_1083261 [Paraphaeosphaeria sporulosa]
MFSRDDILEIYDSLPPEKDPQSQNDEDLALLIRTVSGHSFITAHDLRQDFERIVITKATRTAVKSASSDLDVEVDVVLQLIQGNPALALLSQDGSTIISSAERDTIVKNLEDMLNKKLVSKADFIQSHDVHEECLASLLRIPSIRENLADEGEDHLLGKVYSRIISEEMNRKLIRALEKNETVVFNSQSLPGTPPMWLVQLNFVQVSSNTVNGDALSSQFHIEQEVDVIRCTPKQSLLSQRDELVAKLRSGNIFAIDLGHFGQTFRDLYTSSAALQQHLLESPYIITLNGSLSAYAVSTERLSKLADDAQRKLGQDYVDLNTIITTDVPGDIKELVLDNVTQRILTTVSNHGEGTRRVKNYLMKNEWYSLMQEEVTGLAKTRASTQWWDSLKDTSDKDPKFQMADVLTATVQQKNSNFSEHMHVLHAVAQQKDSEVAAAEQFSITISDLESKNENDFSMFWAEKVSQRVHNYREALKAIDETKLSEQLTDLLSSYLHKDLLPEAISKARTQGLVRSRKTRKNVTKFEATLKASKSDLASILSTFEKFGRKQGLVETDGEAAEAAKKASIQDMVRRMQKPKTDAPSMFLSLVVILFAKHHPGVVYATGKFAPKLLKQLKTKLDDESYEQAEKWKELAKAGSLTTDDRAFMVQMAEAAT